MKYIVNKSKNPYYNLALEEYVLNNLVDDDYLLLWQNDNTVVSGKYQNIMEEINQEVVKEKNVNVVRRITGGGTVYHDLGNLNFSLITKWDNNSEVALSYANFLNPVICTLNKFGVKATLKGRNDLVVEDKKISGNAQAIVKNRILHHGTLLINSNLDFIPEVLTVQSDKIISKGIKSVRSRVANISEYATKKVTVEDFESALIEHFLGKRMLKTITLNEKQLKEVEDLKVSKYDTWEWNHGSSPKANYTNAKRFDCGKISLSLFLENGVIKECSFSGDFLASKDLEDVVEKLIDLPYDFDKIKNVLQNLDLRLYFGQITLDELMSLFL